MEKALFCLPLLFFSVLGFSQSKFISYEDIKLILRNNLQQVDTFLMAKGYTIKLKNDKTKNREYTLPVNGGAYVNLTIRVDGKKLFMELETNELQQYDLINNSISQYLNKAGSSDFVQTYAIKDLCSIYITVTDTTPYDPMKRDYDMQIIPDKNVSAYN